MKKAFALASLMTGILIFTPICAQDSELDRLLFDDVEAQATSEQKGRHAESRGIAGRQIGTVGDVVKLVTETEQRIRTGKLDTQTIAMQTQILDALRTLKRSGDNQAVSQTQHSSANQGPGERTDGLSGTEPGTETDTSFGPTNNGTDQTTDPHSDNEQENMKLLNRAWGHLPSGTIDKLNASGVPSFLPSYRSQIEEYYKRLSKLPNKTPSDQ
ncbi:MAG: hypothetical protein KDB27_07605 [Planctomycetales bacterium]|nr:hypothetical protein [Planctomycetales bacterium]